MPTTYRVYYAQDMMAGYRTPAFKASEYTQVAFVEADNLGDLFRQMNVVDGTEIPVELKIRSMSCGDVAVDQTTEKTWFCAPVGWVELHLCDECHLCMSEGCKCCASCRAVKEAQPV